MYTFDTNAIIYYLKNEAAASLIVSGIFEKRVPVYVATITELELFGYPHLTSQEAELIEALLQSVSIIPLDSRLARTAGQIRSRFRLEVSDSIIAATALSTGTTLVTRNIKDFKNVPNLSLLKI